MQAVLTKIQAAGLTLNADKCEFNKTEIHFLGHVSTERAFIQIPEN